MGETTPRILRIAGDVGSARNFAEVMTEVTGERYHPLWVESLGMLGAMIAVTKRVASGVGAAFPPWQVLQDIRDQFSGCGKLQPLDNARYPDLGWTTVDEMMRQRQQDL